MSFYAKQFTKPYPNGYVDKPQKTTPVTAEILNMQDKAFSALEAFLTSADVGFYNVTVGYRKSTPAQGNYSLSVGNGNAASGRGSVAFGNDCTASGNWSHAMGEQARATKLCASAEGENTEASGSYSHAEGTGTKAKGIYSHAEGYGTVAAGAGQHTQGKWNIEDTENKYAHIVGGGETYDKPKNIHTLDWEGNAVYSGDVTNGNGVSLDGLMELIGSTGQLRTIVETLPEEDISTSTIYMVLKESGGDNDIYNEYINVDGTPEGWEFIGNSAVDLSDYYTKSQVDDILSGYVPAEFGKGLSSNDYTDDDKELVDSIKNMTAADALQILNGEVA
ncbi:MAG: hypothetical protein NC548_35600 [Lachnospiraceae bacterium]|nr:hypothetical protein [Lachnospiraceae bacterium]MCM1232704.1 hypothetical protein [Ruminococcus flavefaciens]